jgi:predicted naringenin-chalcone synthase
MFISGIGTATPPRRYLQAECLEAAKSAPPTAVFTSVRWVMKEGDVVVDKTARRQLLNPRSRRALPARFSTRC